MSELLALGISHKTAPVALRERLAFTEAGAVELAQRLTGTAEVTERATGETVAVPLDENVHLPAPADVDEFAPTCSVESGHTGRSSCWR